MHTLIKEHYLQGDEKHTFQASFLPPKSFLRPSFFSLFIDRRFKVADPDALSLHIETVLPSSGTIVNVSEDSLFIIGRASLL